MHMAFVNGKTQEYGYAIFNNNSGDKEIVPWWLKLYKGTSMSSDLTVDIDGEHVTLDTGANGTDGVLPYNPSTTRQHKDGSINEYIEIIKDQEGNPSGFLLRNDKSGAIVPTIIAKPTASTVYLNSEETAFEAYNINGNNFFKLRDLAYALNGTENLLFSTCFLMGTAHCSRRCFETNLYEKV